MREVYKRLWQTPASRFLDNDGRCTQKYMKTRNKCSYFSTVPLRTGENDDGSMGTTASSRHVFQGGCSTQSGITGMTHHTEMVTYLHITMTAVHFFGVDLLPVVWEIQRSPQRSQRKTLRPISRFSHRVGFGCSDRVWKRQSFF